MMNINDYINGQKRLHTLEQQRVAELEKIEDVMERLMSDTEYDEQIRQLAAELDGFSHAHPEKIAALYEQYGAYKTADGDYQIVTETSYSELYGKEITYQRDVPFSLVEAICKEV